MRQALLQLGLDGDGAAAAGIRLLKVGLVWPLDPEMVARLAEGVDTVLVVEEKRPLLASVGARNRAPRGRTTRRWVSYPPLVNIPG